MSNIETLRPVYRVVRNLNGQYSLYSAEKEPPAGWTATEVEGDEVSCLAFIDQVWTDLHPGQRRRSS